MAGWNEWVPGTNMTLSEVLDALKSASIGLDVKDKLYWSFFKVVQEAIKEGNANFDVEMAKGVYNTLKDRLDAGDTDMRNISVDWINKNLGKLDQTFMSEEFLQQMAGNAPINAVPAKDSVTINQLAIAKVISANKFDKNSAIPGALNASGQVVTNADFYTSDHIKVSVGDVINTSNGMQSYALYNSSGTLISAKLGAAVSQFTVPANVTTIKVTFFHTNVDFFMLAIGSLPSGYQPFKRVIEDKYIDDVDGEKIKDKTINHDKLSFLNAGKNLFNPETITKGYYIDPVNGSMMENAQYDTTDMITVIPNDEIVATTARFIAFFDGLGNLMPSYGIAEPGNPTNYKFTVPFGARGHRISYSASTTKMQIEKGTQATNYEPYTKVLRGVSLEAKNILSPKSKVTKSSAKGNLSNGQKLTTASNGLKKNKTYSFSSKITSFSGLRLGQGEVDYGGSYIEVTTAQVKFFDYRGAVTPRAILNHGLAVGGFIDVLFSVDKDSQATVRIITNGGFYETPAQPWEGYNGEPFVKSLGSELTDCELVFDTADFSKPIYFFGDSYAGLTSADRWPHYIRSWRFDNWLINGFPGQASLSAKGMLDFVLSKGNPKLLIWAMGMNDADDASAVNANWLSVYNQVRAICADRGIEFIPCTIPNVPMVNNSFKNEIVRASGYRYIDFANAVGGESVGSGWYTGMLSADNIHPAVLGAQKLALRALQDVPELGGVE